MKDDKVKVIPVDARKAWEAIPAGFKRNLYHQMLTKMEVPHYIHHGTMVARARGFPADLPGEEGCVVTCLKTDRWEYLPGHSCEDVKKQLRPNNGNYEAVLSALGRG